MWYKRILVENLPGVVTTEAQGYIGTPSPKACPVHFILSTFSIPSWLRGKKLAKLHVPHFLTEAHSLAGSAFDVSASTFLSAAGWRPELSGLVPKLGTPVYKFFGALPGN